MIETKYLHIDGSPAREGICMMPDHYVTTVSVTIRSQFPVSVSTLKDLIQQRHEVVGDIVPTAKTCYISNGK